LFRIRIERNFGEGVLFLITKKIVAIKDDLYDFAKGLKFERYGNSGEKRSGRGN